MRNYVRLWIMSIGFMVLGFALMIISDEPFAPRMLIMGVLFALGGGVSVINLLCDLKQFVDEIKERN